MNRDSGDQFIALFLCCISNNRPTVTSIIIMQKSTPSFVWICDISKTKTRIDLVSDIYWNGYAVYHTLFFVEFLT